MYYDFVRASLADHKAIELLYRGEKLLIKPLINEKIMLINCRINKSEIYEGFAELELNDTIKCALREENHNIVWADLADNQLLADESEFIFQLNSGGEIEFIYQGIGFFIGRYLIDGKDVWKIQNGYTNENQSFDSVENMLKNALILGQPLKQCISQIEIIAYM